MRNGLPYETNQPVAVDASFTRPETIPGDNGTPEYQDYWYNPIDPTQGAISAFYGQGVPGIPYPVDVDNGTFLPGVAEPLEDMVPGGQWDAYTYAIPQKILDKSVPLEDEYGAASYSSPASFIGEWGGQPYPVRDYQDMDYSVAYSPRKLMNMSGPNGTFYGPQQTAWESDYTDPVVDYQSVIYLGGGTAA